MTYRYLLRYGEIALKGGNRPDFERVLMRRMREALPGERVILRRMGLLVESQREALVDLQRIFGISLIFPVQQVAAELDAIKAAALSLAGGGSFRVTAHRSDKSFPHTSQEIQQLVGEVIHETKHIPVDLKNPECTIYIHVEQESAFVGTQKAHGAGGLPIGVSGNVSMESVRTPADVVAAWLAMKRGCRVCIKEGDEALLDILRSYGWEEGDAKHIVGKVTGATLEDYEMQDGFTLAPLIAFSEKDILEFFKRIQ